MFTTLPESTPTGPEGPVRVVDRTRETTLSLAPRPRKEIPMKQSGERFCSNGSSHTDDERLIGDLLGLPADKVAEALANYDLRTLGTLTEHELKKTGLTPTRARRLHRAFELARMKNSRNTIRRTALSR